MARQPKPWYWRDRKVWCVTIHGQRHNLGRNKQQALEHFRALMQQPTRQRRFTTLPRLVTIVDDFLDWVSRNRAPDTFEWYRGRLQNFIDHYPDLSLEQLKPHHVETWAGNPDRSITTRRNQMRAIKRCLKWAVTQGHLESNPIANLEVPSSQASDSYVSVEDFQQLLASIPNQDFADLLKVTYETGCRPQESLRVEARHVDLKHARWVFPTQEAKGKAMPRVVYLSDHAFKVSQRLMLAHPVGTLFRNSAGKPWNKDSVGSAFDRLQVRMGRAELKRLGESPDQQSILEFSKALDPVRVVKGVAINKTDPELFCEAKRKLTNQRARQMVSRYSLYALRHSWATNALQRGVDSLTVAILMGHKDPSTLARTYQHLSHNPQHLLQQARLACG